MSKLEQLLQYINSEHIYIQTHNFPDPDALACAYGMKRLLEEKNISSTICYKGRIDRHSMRVFKDYLGVELLCVDNSSVMTYKDKIMLVDAQKGNANIVDLIGDETICIDHHPTYEPIEYRFSDIRPEVGACASIVASYFFENNIKMDTKTATALMFGIKVDTANLTRGVSKLDLDMFYQLFDLCDRDKLASFDKNGIEYTDLQAYANAINSIKIYNEISIAHTGENCPEQLIASISDFMLEISQVKCSIVYSTKKDGIKLSVRSCVPEIDSGKITSRALSGIGAGGGHASMAGGFVPYPMEMEHVKNLIDDIENRFMNELL